MKVPGVSLNKNLLKTKMWAPAHMLFFVLTPRYKERHFCQQYESVSCSRNLDKSTSYLLTAGFMLMICIPKSRGNL